MHASEYDIYVSFSDLLHFDNRHRHRERTYGHGGGGDEGKGGMHGESNMEIHITICKIESQWEFAV